MSSYPQSFLFPNNLPSPASQQTYSPCIEGNYSSLPLDIPCTRDNLLSAFPYASADDYVLATPLASPPDFYLDSQCVAPLQQDIASLLFGPAEPLEAPGLSYADGLEPAAVLSSSWPGDPRASDGGYLSLDTASGSLSTSQSDLSCGFPLETPPSDVDLFSPQHVSPYLQPQMPWFYEAPNTLPPCNSPHEIQEKPLFDQPQDPKPRTECGILALLMANPEMWRQATLSKKGTYVCSHCTSQGNHRKFNNLASLAAHFDSHEVMRLCKCDYPSCIWSLIGFSSMPEKVRHLRSQHSNKHYKCGACQRAFLRGDSLKRHLRLVHGREQTTAAEINEMTVNRPFQAASPKTHVQEPVFEFLMEA